MSKKILAMFLALLMLCGVSAVSVSAEDAEATVYTCANDEEKDDLVGFAEKYAEEGVKVTLIQPGDQIKFATNKKAVTVTYYPDVDAVYNTSYKSIVNNMLADDTLLIKNPRNLAVSTSKFKSFENSFGKSDLTNSTYTVLAPDGEEVMVGAWKARDAVGTDLGAHPMQFELNENGEAVQFLGWVMSASTYKSSSGYTVTLYALWAKTPVAKICACGDICIGPNCGETSCGCSDGADCQCACATEPDEPGDPGTGEPENPEKDEMAMILSPVDPEGKTLAQRAAAYAAKVIGVFNLLVNAIVVVLNTTILENLRDIFYAWIGI